MVFCVFFFFKQKTAYEIGTGDWSSDVCSSDLPIGLVMDRYAFKPMGRRRGWILLAHVFMLAALIDRKSVV